VPTPGFWTLTLGPWALIARRRSLAVKKAILPRLWARAPGRTRARPTAAWRGIACRAGRATGTVAPLPPASARRRHQCLRAHAAAVGARL